MQLFEAVSTKKEPAEVASSHLVDVVRSNWNQLVVDIEGFAWLFNEKPLAT